MKKLDDISNDLDNLDSLKIDDEETDFQNSNMSLQPAASGTQKYTKDEIDVLRHGSFINSREYVPFMSHIDTKDKFYFPVPFG